MQPDDPRVEATAVAIAYLTALSETPDRPSNELSRALTAEAYDKDSGGTLIAGLTNVALHLLVKVEKATGQSTAEILQDVARRQQSG